jgi:hypothetical protein
MEDKRRGGLDSSIMEIASISTIDLYLNYAK